MDNALQKIRDFAHIAHGNQKRKYDDAPYIVHPVRVMEACRGFGERFEVLAAALLHDVLEDTPVTTPELNNFLLTVNEASAHEILKIVIDLSDVYIKSAYPKLNRHARKNRELERFVKASAEAHTVKYADICDNSFEMARYDREFAPRYLAESLAILRNADKGNPALRQKAIQVVQRSFAELR